VLWSLLRIVRYVINSYRIKLTACGISVGIETAALTLRLMVDVCLISIMLL